MGVDRRKGAAWLETAVARGHAEAGAALGEIRQMEAQIAEEQGEEAAARAWEAKEEI